MKIPLFDVDGTLTMKGNRIQDRALRYAFHKLYSLDASMDEITSHGLIEAQIVTEILKLHGFKKEDVKKDLEKIYDTMREYILSQKDTLYRPKPGAIELLETLQQKGFTIGVLTGNMDTVAEAKLGTAGLWKYVDFGAYGNEGEVRTDLVSIAKNRAEQILKRKIEDKEVVIIGDTQRDILCAQQTGIACIAVASGMVSKQDLEKAGPDMLVESLEEKDAILSFLEN